MKDYYDILGIDEKATQDAVKKAYRRLARKYHPDRNPGDRSAEEHFKSVQEAYEVLSDPQSRRSYDRVRRNPFSPEGDFVTSGGTRFHRRPDGTYVRTGDAEPTADFDPLGGLGDLFSRMFGAEPETKPRPDPETTVEISFDQMLRGGKAGVRLPEGRVVEIPFPEGVRDGYRVRVRSKGSESRFVRFRVREDPRFRRDGSDLRVSLRVNVFEALLGVTKSLVSPYGRTLKVTVPKGAQPGDRLRLRGQGIRSADGTGDLIVELQVTVPRDLSGADEEAIRKAAGKAGLV